LAGDKSRHLYYCSKLFVRVEAETFNKTLNIRTYIVYIQFGAVETKVLNNVLSGKKVTFRRERDFTSVLETELSLEYSSCKYDTEHG